MSYKMRFVQYFDKSNSQAFLDLERGFVELEKRTPDMKRGRRFVPIIGREPTNTMIWEADYDSAEDAMRALRNIEENSEHDVLLDDQIKVMRDTYVEIYKELI